MLSDLGPLLGRGRTSEVFELGSDLVVKVPRPEVPGHWAAKEASIAASVHEAGLPTPGVHGTMDVGGRESIIFERIHGPSMWDMVMDDPARLPALTEQMVAVQRQINQVAAPEAVPGLQSRIRSKICETAQLSGPEQQVALDLADSLPSGVSLCHGDLHPGNILMGADGPVVIDWFDAAAGPGPADLVRTSLLIRSSTAGIAPDHLPGASSEILDRLHQLYLGDALSSWDCSAGELLQWERVLAASRLAERTTVDDADLLELWRSAADHAGPKTELARSLSQLGHV